jgi:uncharacterized membrane protein YkvA (DUF1232 family)
MFPRLTSLVTRTGLLRTFVSHARLAVRLLREPQVPAPLKALPIGALLYVLSPIDVIPDVIPVLGQLDDISFLILALEGFLKLCPAGAVTFHRASIAARRAFSPMGPAGDVIDAEWRHEG